MAEERESPDQHTLTRLLVSLRVKAQLVHACERPGTAFRRCRDSLYGSENSGDRH
jgi:hypothetical protein